MSQAEQNERPAAPFRGSCLCKGVVFLVSRPFLDPLNCHCKMCQKAHGAAFRTRVTVLAKNFEWLQGEPLVKRYQSSQGEFRAFCSNCGSRLITEFIKEPAVYGLPLAILDDDPGIAPKQHVFVGSKASWLDLSDDLPQSIAWPSKSPDKME